jgi:hypothetical protein
MKTKLLLSFFMLVIALLTATAQVPQGFNYQAVATTGTGSPIAGQTFKVRITLQTTQTGGTIVWQEEQTVTTNQSGLFSIVIGSGTQTGGSTAFKDIEWNNQTIYLKTEVNYPSSWTTMGAAKVWSVPFALVADKANSIASGSKLQVVGQNDASPEALFEVRRKDGHPVFLVYPDSVRIWVPNAAGAKGSKGGFAIGGYSEAKAGPQEYFRVTPDSVRIYLDPTPSTAKGSKGGFAIGGYSEAKGGIGKMYFNLSPSTTVSTVLGSPQVLWYPQRNAFLAGNVRIASVDSVGDYSTALGYWSRAAGNYSQAFGYKSFAEGNYSTAIGKKAIAGVYKSKHNAFALGNSTKALGEDSYAFGSAAIASGEKSFAFGSVAIDSSGHALTTPTTASGLFSTAIGMGAQATNTGSLAFGNSSVSKGYASMALGFYSTVESTGNYGVAIGYGSRSNNTYALAFGLKANANAPGSMSLGPYSSTGTTATNAGSFGYSADALAPYSISIGYNAQTPSTGTSAGSFGYNASAAGPYSVAIGPYSTTGAAASYAGAFGYSADALGANSVAIGYNAGTATTGTSAGSFGYNAVANGPTSVAIGSGAQTGATATDAGSFGKGAVANGISSVAIGSSATTGASAKNAGSFGYTATANGENSVAVGYGAITSGLDASAFGKSATASGSSSMALGTTANASGATSVSIGYSSDATNVFSVAMGYDAQSTGQYSMALGYQSLASNTSSTALGYNSQATGTYSTALGYNSLASGDKSLALGSFYTYSYTRCFINKLTGTFTCRPYTGTVINQAKRGYSVAIGNGNTAEDGGIALGSRNNSLSSGSVAIGYLNTADTTFGFAAGYNSVSRGISAIALGDNVTAEASSSLVVGSFNKTNAGYNRYQWVETDPLFVIGNGDENAQSDAMVVLKNGSVKFPGLVPQAGSGGYYVYALSDGTIIRMTSSSRYKHDINSIDDYSWLYNLRPVDYLFNNDDNGSRQYGFIAEEVDQVNKELVTYRDGQPDAVNYMNLVAPLVKAVQDQKKTIESLQNENEMLKQRLEKLETLVNSVIKQ